MLYLDLYAFFLLERQPAAQLCLLRSAKFAPGVASRESLTVNVRGSTNDRSDNNVYKV